MMTGEVLAIGATVFGVTAGFAAGRFDVRSWRALLVATALVAIGATATAVGGFVVAVPFAIAATTAALTRGMITWQTHPRSPRP
jgi:ABC-type glycerol-3-phosphate transport system permease component